MKIKKRYIVMVVCWVIFVIVALYLNRDKNNYDFTYMNQAALTVDKNHNGEIEIKTPNAELTESETGELLKVIADTYVYSSADSSSSVCGELAKGTELLVFSKVSDDWCKVSFNGRVAYVLDAAIEDTEEIPTVPPTTGPEEPTTPKPTTPKPTTPSTEDNTNPSQSESDTDAEDPTDESESGSEEESSSGEEESSGSEEESSSGEEESSGSEEESSSGEEESSGGEEESSSGEEESSSGEEESSSEEQSSEESSSEEPSGEEQSGEEQSSDENPAEEASE